MNAMGDVLHWTDKDGHVWDVPDGYEPGNVGACKACGQSMLWTTTRAGNRAPLNPDGTSHFATCPYSDRFRKPKR
jgi:hypothetical protein